MKRSILFRLLLVVLLSSSLVSIRAQENKGQEISEKQTAVQTSTANEIVLDNVDVSKEGNQTKKLKKIAKLRNPKWLLIDGDRGIFKDDKSSYVASNALDSRLQTSGRLVSKSRSQFVLGNTGINKSSTLDYSRIEKRITQVALLQPELKMVEIEVSKNCSGYNDIQYLLLNETDLQLVRSVNTIEGFLNNNIVSHPSVNRKIIAINETLCK